MVVHGLAGGLHDEHVAAADRLKDGYGAFSVRKALDIGFPHREMEIAGDAFSEGRVSVPGKDLYFLAV
jgi:hypothetical protein